MIQYKEQIGLLVCTVMLLCYKYQLIK